MLPRQRGFTLVELIITVIVAAVLAAIAVPNMSVFVKNNARAARLNSMVTALNYARAEAVDRNVRVTLCKSAAFADCDAVGNGEFENGWIVFIDGGVLGTVDGADEILRVFQPDMGGVATMRGRNGIAGAALGQVTYRGNGFPLALPASTIFNYCDDRGVAQARAIRVATSGHLRMTRDTDGDGTDDIGGAELVCP